VALTFNFRQPAEPYLALMGGLIARGCEHRRMGSTAMALCHVADGRCDAMATLSCSSWDVLAGLLTAEEAGGVASDFVASHGLLGQGGVMASTPALAAAVGEASGLGAG
jgi:myo-inositol-1(or 4)-monophosphatase